APGAVAGTTITLPYDPELSTGDSVIYSSGGGTPIGGLVDGGSYYVKMTSDRVLQLTTSKCLTESPVPSGCTGVFIPLDASVATGRGHSIVLQGAQPSPDPSAVSGVRSVTPDTDEDFVGVAVTATSSDDIAGVGV